MGVNTSGLGGCSHIQARGVRREVHRGENAKFEDLNLRCKEGAMSRGGVHRWDANTGSSSPGMFIFNVLD